MHRESVRDALRVVRERPVDAVLVSVHRCAGDAPALLEQFTRSFPSVPTVALVTRREPGDAEALLRLGATGVRQVVDATDPAGWRRLREVLGAPPTERAQAILTPVMEVLGPISSGSRRFWEQLVRTAPETTTVRRLADALSITPSTLVSRFVRSGLPSPKDHLVAIRLCHAAKLFDDGDLTIADVAYRLDFASPAILRAASAGRPRHHAERVSHAISLLFRAAAIPRPLCAPVSRNVERIQAAGAGAVSYTARRCAHQVEDRPAVNVK